MMKIKLLLKKMTSNCSILFCLLGSVFQLMAQDVKFTSVNPVSDVLVISNPGVTMVDLTNYQLCLGPGTYVQVGSLTPISGSVLLQAGSDLELSYPGMDEMADGLSLFSNSNFSSSSSNDLISYLQWGAANQPRVVQAVTAGRWDSAMNFVSGPGPYTTSIGGSAASWTACTVDGGEIQITGTTDTATSICVGEGVDDLISVEFTSTSNTSGTNGTYVITDNATGNILELPAAGPFNLEGAPAGICDIWYLRYEDGLTGLAAGNNVSNLVGCFDFSNAISVTRLSGSDCDALSVDDFETNFSFNAYPNPTSDFVTLHYTGNQNLDLDVKVIDMLGKQIMSKIFSTGNDMSLDLRNVARGSYFLNISDQISGARITKKVIKN